MSLGGQTSANSSTGMEVNNEISSPVHTSSTRSAMESSATTARGASSSSQECGPASEGSTSSCCKGTSALDKKTSEVSLESLRWENPCLDEEKEKERIEIYKVNRRKRYENAMEEKKAQLSLCTTNKAKYYI